MTSLAKRVGCILVVAVLVSFAGAALYVVGSLVLSDRSSVARIKEKGGVVRRLLWVVKYIDFGAGFDDADLAALLPALQSIPTLEQIDFSGSAITDRSLVHLRTLSQVNVMVVRNSRITQQGVEWLQERRSDLDVVD